MRWWKFSTLLVTVHPFASTSAFSEIEGEKAAIVAARHARSCYVEMLDGQLKCGGRPQRSLSAARSLLERGSRARTDVPVTCESTAALWVFKWRGFPDQAPILIDAETGKLVRCP
jgi:hypothetical protein